MGLFGKREEPMRLTHDEWIKWLETHPLTLEEFSALEQAHSNQLLGQVVDVLEMHFQRLEAGLGVHPEMTGGYLEQLRNILDGILKRAIESGRGTPPERRLQAVPPTRLAGGE